MESISILTIKLLREMFMKFGIKKPEIVVKKDYRVGIKIEEDVQVSAIAVFVKNDSGKVVPTADVLIWFEERDDKIDFTLWNLRAEADYDIGNLRQIVLYDRFGETLEEFNMNGALVEVIERHRVVDSKIIAW